MRSLTHRLHIHFTLNIRIEKRTTREGKKLERSTTNNERIITQSLIRNNGNLLFPLWILDKKRTLSCYGQLAPRIKLGLPAQRVTFFVHSMHVLRIRKWRAEKWRRRSGVAVSQAVAQPLSEKDEEENSRGQPTCAMRHRRFFLKWKLSLYECK